MGTVRRVYILVICALSLQGVTWAVVALLRNLLRGIDRADTEAVAFWIAVIIIGLPVFLFHWLWTQRIAGREEEERGSPLRRLYLYGMLAALLAPFVINSYNLLLTLMRLMLGVRQPGYSRHPLSPGESVIHDLIALAILALLWFYHQRVIAEDARVVPETGIAATIRRLYVLIFSGVGLTLTTIGLIQLLAWLMHGAGRSGTLGGSIALAREASRLLTGVALWAIFWRWAQRLFSGPREEERESVLRKVYLYLVVFLAVFGVVTSVTLVLDGFFRRLLKVFSDGDARLAAAVILSMGLLWVYHAYVLHQDAAVTGEGPRQAQVRRIYFYLVAAVGLGGLVEGIGGNISVLIRSLAESGFDLVLKNQLAWGTAVLIAGLTVWIVPWRRVQVNAAEPGPPGIEERRSLARRIYLYFYLFVATMTALAAVVFVVFRLLSRLLGAPSQGNLASELGHAIAFSLIAVGVWLYHGALLRQDNQLIEGDQAGRLTALRVAVLDVGDGHMGRMLLDGLRKELPALRLAPIGLTGLAAEAMGAGIGPEGAAPQLAEADLIVGPWVVAVPGGAGGAVSVETAQAVSSSPARKLLVPTPVEGWDWVGLGRWKAEEVLRQTVRTVRQIAEGRGAEVAQRLGAGTIIAIILGVILLLFILGVPLGAFFRF